MSETPEFSPTDWVRDQTRQILDAGTTDVVQLGQSKVVLFTTTGAKSGIKRYVPLMRVEEDGKYAMVASKGGAPQHPSWYFNVKAHPEVQVLDGDVWTTMTARELPEGDEREHWWTLAVAAFPPYADYQRKTERTIPIFLLEPR